MKCPLEFSLALLSFSTLTPLAVKPPLCALPLALRLRLPSVRSRRRRQAPVMASMLPGSPLVQDICAAAVTAGVALGLLRFWEQVAKRRVFEQKLNRKLVHISVGLVFMLFWPLFSSGTQAPFLAALAIGVNIIRMLLLGLGIWRNEAMVKSISRHGDYRELLKGPLYYACAITLATSVFWRTSPIGIAAICNLCAGDGLADIVGRRFGKKRISYNPNKTMEGDGSCGFHSIDCVHALLLNVWVHGRELGAVRALPLGVSCCSICRVIAHKFRTG